jgi:formylglycine-generating enzyme required for sulfatase activity
LSIKEDLGWGIELEMVQIPTGHFGDRQGNIIKISKPFYLSKTPVTQAQWLVTMGKDKNPSFFKGADYPVECVSWWDCQIFLKKLNQKTGKKYRLPTETEWEYGCRGVQTEQAAITIYHFGNEASKLQEYAWYDDNSQNRTQAVGLKKSNPFGLYDMYGNVNEWCEDDWDVNYASPRPQKAHKKSSSAGKVIRGGSWFFSSGDCCSAYRSWCSPDHKSHDLGLRILLPV